MISDDLSLGIDEPVETYSTSDHLFTDLDIPTTASSGATSNSTFSCEASDAARIIPCDGIPASLRA